MTPKEKAEDYCTCPYFGYYTITGKEKICCRCNRAKPDNYQPIFDEEKKVEYEK